MKPFETISFEKPYRIGGDYAAFAYIQDRLRELAVPEARGVQVKGFVLPAGWTIEDGVITPDFVGREYGLVCTGVPGAIGTCPALLDFGQGHEWATLDVLVKMRLDTQRTGYGLIFSLINESSAPLIEFGLGENELLVKHGTDQYDQPLPNFNIWGLGEWVEFGLAMRAGLTECFFYVDGRTTSLITFLNSFPTSTTQILRIGSAGMTIREVQMMMTTTNTNADYRYSDQFLQYPESYYTPFPKKRIAGAIHYYNFEPGATADVVEDLSLVDPYRTPLALVTANASLQEIDVV